MIKVNTRPDVGHISADEAKAVMISATDLARGLDSSGAVERYILSQDPESMYNLSLCLLQNHEHVVDCAARDYAKKYVPEVAESHDLFEEVLDGLADAFEYSWIVDDKPRCYVRTPYNPNWESLYYLRVTLMPIEDAAEHKELPYTTDDIQLHKERHGGVALCIFSGSLVEQPNVH